MGDASGIHWRSTKRNSKNLENKEKVRMFDSPLLRNEEKTWCNYLVVIVDSYREELGAALFVSV